MFVGTQHSARAEISALSTAVGGLECDGTKRDIFYLVGVFSPDTPKTFDANGVSVCRWQRALSLLCLLCLEQVADAAQTDIYLAKKDAKIGE